MNSSKVAKFICILITLTTCIQWAGSLFLLLWLNGVTSDYFYFFYSRTYIWLFFVVIYFLILSFIWCSFIFKIYFCLFIFSSYYYCCITCVNTWHNKEFFSPGEKEQTLCCQCHDMKYSSLQFKYKKLIK